MKVWKLPVLIGTTDEYSRVQIAALEEWFNDFEQKFRDDFSYIRLKVGKPEFAGKTFIEEKPYPIFVQDWQNEADQKLEECLNPDVTIVLDSGEAL